MKQTLFLMLGYPGAGKTTAAKIIHELTGATYLSSDELRKQLFPDSTFSQTEHNQLYKKLDDALEDNMRNGGSVVYDANLNRRVHRDEKYRLAQKYGHRTVLLWVQAPKDIAKQRRIDEASHHHLVPSHETPSQMFERTVGVFEPPQNEKYIELDGTKIDTQYVRKKLAHAGLEF